MDFSFLPFCCAAALASLDLIEKQYTANAAEVGAGSLRSLVFLARNVDHPQRAFQLRLYVPPQRGKVAVLHAFRLAQLFKRRQRGVERFSPAQARNGHPSRHVCRDGR